MSTITKMGTGPDKMTLDSPTALAVLTGLAAFLWGCVWWLAKEDELLPTRRLRGWLARLWKIIRQPKLRKAYDDDEVIDEDWAVRNTQEDQ